MLVRGLYTTHFFSILKYITKIILYEVVARLTNVVIKKRENNF